MQIVKKIIYIAIVFGIGYVFYWLFAKYISCTYTSDIPTHISMALKSHNAYSLVHIIIKYVYKLPYAWILFGIILTIVILCTIWSIYLYFIDYLKYRDIKLLILSTLLIFTCNIYLPKYNPHFYSVDSMVTQPWHNTTYIFMRFFSIPTIFYFFKVVDQIKVNKTKNEDWILFLIFFSLCNFSKPNFFIAFAPTAFLLVVYLLAKEKSKNIKYYIVLCIIILISSLCIVYQTSILYDSNNQSSIKISLKQIHNIWTIKTLIMIFSHLLFPLYVLFLIVKKSIKEKTILGERLIFVFVLFFIARLEQLLFVETGPRKNDGNFSWGVYNAGILLFIVAVGELIKYQEKKFRVKELGFIILGCHIISGLVYFANILKGNSFIV